MVVDPGEKCENRVAILLLYYLDLNGIQFYSIYLFIFMDISRKRLPNVQILARIQLYVECRDGSQACDTGPVDLENTCWNNRK